MPINQGKFRPPQVTTTPSDGVVARLATGFSQLSATNLRLDRETLRVDGLTSRLGDADLPVLERRLFVIEQSAGALPARVNAMEGRISKLEQAHAGLAEQHGKLSKVTDERIDNAFELLKQLRNELDTLQKDRIDDKPPGKGGKSSN